MNRYNVDFEGDRIGDLFINLSPLDAQQERVVKISCFVNMQDRTNKIKMNILIVT